MSYAKGPWRDWIRATLWDARRMESKLWDGDKFRYPFLDMMGDIEGTALPDMYQTLQPYLKSRDHFIAVENDPVRIYKYMRASERAGAEGLPFQAHYGDAYRVAKRVSQKSPAGVYCFDAVGMAGDVSWWRDYGTVLKDVVDTTCDTLGFCALFLNKTLDPRSNSDRPSTILRRHTDEFVKLFESSRSITRTRLLGEGRKALSVVDDTKFGRSPQGAKAGVYQIYLSEGRHHRMVTLPVLFQGSHVVRPLQ